MKKRFVLAAVTAAIGIGVTLQLWPKRGLASGPIIGETQHDFGVLPAEGPAEYRHTFAVKNVSGRVLRVRAVRPSGGCVISEHDDAPIEHGRSFSITSGLRVTPGRRFQEHVAVWFEGEEHPVLFTLTAVSNSGRAATLPPRELQLASASTLDIVFADGSSDELPLTPVCH